MLRFVHLRSRIVLYFTALMILIEISAFVTVNAVNSRSARETLDHELQTGERVFLQQLELRNEQLREGAKLLIADFGFREAIATHDLPTIQSALVNQSQRIHARKMMLFSNDGKLLAATLQSGADDPEQVLSDLLAQARRQGQASAIRIVDDAIYQLVVVPVKAPLPIAWVAMGFVIDDTLARHMGAVTGLEVSFLERQTGGGWNVLASTLPSGAGAMLAASLRSGASTTGTLELSAAGSSYESRLLRLRDDDGRQIAALLQRSLDQALAPFHLLRTLLVLLALTSLVLSVLAGFFIADGITQPLTELTRSAVRIREGDYTSVIAPMHNDEIGVLADSLDHMRRGIAEREGRILRLAYEDPLTGLYNRLGFNRGITDRIRSCGDGGACFAVLILDLDRFTLINGALGHEVGDLVLKSVAARLTALASAVDVVARLGGDEFGIVAPVPDLTAASDLAWRVLKALEQPLVIEDQPIDVGASLGVATYPADGADPAVLVHGADAAMHMARQTKTGLLFFDRGRDVRESNQLSLLGELRRAVDGGELKVWYQPKIDLSSGTVSGVEALVRWQHPQRGLVPPLEFIPFAERTGFIRALTRWILDAALRDAGRWRSEGLGLGLSINISTSDLLDPELPEIVAGLLERHGVPAGLVSLEITESSFMQDPALALTTLGRLDALGLQLSIDDFGTGYSSLAYLKKLPVDEMKIDQAFIRQMVESEHDLAIVRSTVDLAHNLGLKVVAEGVETQACFDQLRQLGCDQAQGYFMSRPLPEEQLRQFLRRSHWAGDADSGRDAAAGTGAAGHRGRRGSTLH